LWDFLKKTFGDLVPVKRDVPVRGALTIVLSSEQMMAKAMSVTRIGTAEVEAKVFQRPTNVSRGVIHGVSQDMTMEQLLECVVGEPKVLKAQRLGKSATVSLQFQSRARPDSVRLGVDSFRVHPDKRYDPLAPKQCSNCLRVGHVTVHCRRSRACLRCAAEGHSRNDCTAAQEKCAVCGGPHMATFSKCPTLRPPVQEVQKGLGDPSSSKPVGDTRGQITLGDFVKKPAQGESSTAKRKGGKKGKGKASSAVEPETSQVTSKTADVKQTPAGKSPVPNAASQKEVEKGSTGEQRPVGNASSHSKSKWRRRNKGPASQKQASERNHEGDLKVQGAAVPTKAVAPDAGPKSAPVAAPRARTSPPLTAQQPRTYSSVAGSSGAGNRVPSVRSKAVQVTPAEAVASATPSNESAEVQALKEELSELRKHIKQFCEMMEKAKDCKDASEFGKTVAEAFTLLLWRSGVNQ